MNKVNIINEEIRLLNIKNAAERALLEAEMRRNINNNNILPAEINGYNGPEPTRYNDWEKKGIISDF